jgi:PAS domain S-box-containing protein/diguanylate cyclase (GGDEF)-like protein
MPDRDAAATRSHLTVATRAAEALVGATLDAVVTVDARGVIESWNPGAERMFGYAREDAIGRGLGIIVPEAMQGEHTAGMRRLMAGGAPHLLGRAVEVPARRADGSQFPIEMRLSMWRDGEATHFGAVIRDISERRRAEDLLHHLAHYDQLTMLPNRHMFLRRLADALRAEGGGAVTVLIVDFDDFASVNDLVGHAAGDALLKAAAVTLKRFVTNEHSAETDAAAPTVARIGGNQFGVFLPGARDGATAQAAADRIRATVAGTRVDGLAEPALSSAGVAVAPAHGTTPAALLANADFALRGAKRAGGDRSEIFQPSRREAQTARRQLEAEVRRAWAAAEFEVYYQPQVALADRAVVGAEALLRWNHPTRGVLAPGAFLDALGPTELAERIGEWVLKTACRDAARWGRETGRPFRVGVNLFERQFLRGDLADKVAAALEASRLPPECLEIEITENVMTGGDDVSVHRVRRLRDLGVGVAFDDYGTGYASLSLLKRYPLTRLKIDRSFVRDLSFDENDATLVELILTLGERFKLGVVAEGVETEEQEARLIALGCPEGQGYFYGRPMTAEALGALLRAAGPRAVVA